MGEFIPNINSGSLWWRMQIYDIFAHDQSNEANKWVIGYDGSPEILAGAREAQIRAEEKFQAILKTIERAT